MMSDRAGGKRMGRGGMKKRNVQKKGTAPRAKVDDEGEVSLSAMNRTLVEQSAEYSPGIPPAVEAYLNSSPNARNRKGVSKAESASKLTEARSSPMPSLVNTLSRSESNTTEAVEDERKENLSSSSPGLVNTFIGQVGTRLNTGLQAVGVEISYDRNTCKPTSATVAGMTLHVEDVRVVARQVKETVKQRVGAVAVRGRELASATIATVHNVPKVLLSYTVAEPTGASAAHEDVTWTGTGTGTIAKTAHVFLDDSDNPQNSQSKDMPLKQRPPTVLKPYLNLMKRALVSVINFVFMVCNLLGFGSVLGINEKTGLYAREVVNTVCDVPDAALDHAMAVTAWAADLTKMWLSFWFDLSVHLCSLPVSIAKSALSIMKTLCFTFLVAFLNRAPGGHKILKALNGHVSGH
jgi:hypothetical protein